MHTTRFEHEFEEGDEVHVLVMRSYTLEVFSCVVNDVGYADGQANYAVTPYCRRFGPRDVFSTRALAQVACDRRNAEEATDARDAL